MFENGQTVYFLENIVWKFQENNRFVHKGFICGKNEIDGKIVYSIIEPIETEFAATSISNNALEEDIFLTYEEAFDKLYKEQVYDKNN